MIDSIRLKKKRLMAIVLMIIIMLLTLLLMITSFSLEHIVGSNMGSRPSIKHDKEVDALGTLLMPESVDLYVNSVDLTKDKVGSLEYISIYGEQKSGTISLKSNADTTTCTYSIIYTTDYNYFENKYTLSDGSLGTLKSQLLLSLSGSQMNGINQTGLSTEVDLIEIKDKKTVLLKDILITDEEDNKTTTIEWKFVLSFRNYRDYDQINNGGKSTKGRITFEFGECERTK